MPRLAAFAARAMATLPAMRLPESVSLPTRPLCTAAAVAGPAAVPVETMPAVALTVPVPMVSRLALRRPTLAHFQPVEETATGLAAPAATAGPEVLESMPQVAAFAALPVMAPAAPAMLDRPLAAAGAGLALVGFREGAAPRVEAPRAGQLDSRRVSVEPMARIAAQPAGVQPERPKPAIPRPGMFALEYYCHRISSKPTCEPACLEPQISMQLLRTFPVPAALQKFADYGASPRRKILPFEEIFALHKKRTEARKNRVNLGNAGKIAAAVMVAVALWAGSRLAGVAQQAQALRVQVSGSERVLVAEGRSAQATGTMTRVRRAIADRAAMVITDNFTGGMAAWGAEAGKKYANGWSHHADGYVKTGEMALFKPSLNYTDYHMEFYGQIEEKSMGWVVRAQDKKNYYAMKFKIVEPGLRPMIAMVHYQVTNGKPGRIRQTPLSVMVHNNEPYHVSVDVRGNRFMAAIEGEPVEAWTDDAPGRGGVGFFSEAGERARLYWMKISRNQDWLGRLCAALSDNSAGAAQTAELWGPEFPPQLPGPVNPRVPDAALPVRMADLDGWESPYRAQIAKNRRSEGWIS
jgi:hypothetical protein